MQAANSIANWVIFTAIFTYVSGFFSLAVTGIGLIIDELFKRGWDGIIAHPIIIATLLVPLVAGAYVLARQIQSLRGGSFEMKKSFTKAAVFFVFGNVIGFILTPLLITNIAAKDEPWLLIFLFLGTMYTVSSVYVWTALFEFFRRNVGKYQWFRSRPASVLLAITEGAGGILLLGFTAYVACLRGFSAASDTLNVIIGILLCVKSVYHTSKLLKK